MVIIDCAYKVLVALKNLIVHPKNPNRHSLEQIEILAKLIQNHGFRHPIIVSKRSGFIVAGHGRKLAAEKLGMGDAPVDYQDFSSDEEEYQFMTSDNEVARWSELDYQSVYDAIKEFPMINVEMLAIENFKLPEVEVVPGCDEDSVPEIKFPITVKGDVWILGDHRLMCGDSVMIGDVEKLIKNEKMDMIYTDPPYGINESGDRSKREGNNSLRDGVVYENFKDDSVSYAIDAYNLCESFDIPIQIWWGANYYSHSIPQSNNWLVWDKRIEEKQRDFNSDAELAYVKNKKSSVRIFRHLWKGLIKGSEHGQARVHPTQKPIALAEWCFEEYAKDSETVLDLFLGSGSSLIACEKTNRKCFGMEISEHYCDVIINRWQNYSAKTAILESTGQSYNDLCEIRKK